MRVAIAAAGTGWVTTREGEPKKFEDWEQVASTEFPDGKHFSYSMMIDDGKVYLEAYDEGLRLMRFWADRFTIQGVQPIKR
jgi:hypothetical protein